MANLVAKSREFASEHRRMANAVANSRDFASKHRRMANAVANSRDFASSCWRTQANGECSAENRRNQAKSGEKWRKVANSPGVNGEGWRTQYVVANLKLVGPIEALKCGCCRRFCDSGEIRAWILTEIVFSRKPSFTPNFDTPYPKRIFYRTTQGCFQG